MSNVRSPNPDAPALRFHRARGNASNRLLYANACRLAAKAIGKTWPIDDEAAQQSVLEAFDVAVKSGEGVVNESASKRARDATAELYSIGFILPTEPGAA